MPMNCFCDVVIFVLFCFVLFVCFIVVVFNFDYIILQAAILFIEIYSYLAIY